MVIQGSEEGILIFLRQLRLITLGHESEDDLFHFLLRHFGLLGVLNLIPGIFLTLRVWHGGEAVDSSLDGFIGLIIAKNLLHETKLGHLLHRGHATESLQNIALIAHGQIGDHGFLSVLEEGLSALEPSHHELTVVLRLEKLIQLLNDFLLDILGSGFFGDDLEQCIEELLSRLRLFVDGEEV
jgi:hypothetical protein